MATPHRAIATAARLDVSPRAHSGWMYKDPKQQRAAERRWYRANKATVAAKKDRKRAPLRQLVREALAIEGELRFDA